MPCDIIVFLFDRLDFLKLRQTKGTQMKVTKTIIRGLDAAWMTSSAIDPVTGKRVKVLDLAGSIRISSSHVDIGCYERFYPKGIAIVIR